eukprot:TRINITY_DN28107_c0_g1_i1.p1 TRINITY_DN28107_c0_g1~~TRINITY_DN28107_c0_g1_i1.p1  ORF type:complete len:488 (-),score=131.31 TRINITY_DN28107_c0_g1_i1:82-1545(-)
MKLPDLLRPIPPFELLPFALRPDLSAQLSEVRERLARGKQEELEDVVEDYKAAYSAKGDAFGEAMMQLALADVLMALGDGSSALELSKQACDAFKALRAPEEAAAMVVAARTAVALCSSGEPTSTTPQFAWSLIAEAQASLRAAGKALGAAGSGEAAALELKAEADLVIGEPIAAVAGAKSALRCSRSSSDLAKQVALLRLLTLASLRARWVDEAVKASNLLVTKSQELGDVLGKAVAAHIAYEAQSTAGQLHEAARWAESSAALFAEAGNVHYQAEALLCCSRSLSGRINNRQANAQQSNLAAWADQALDTAEKALTLQRQCCSVKGEAEALLSRAVALLGKTRSGSSDRETITEAVADAKEAQLLFTDISDRRGAAASLVVQSQALATREDLDEAGQALRKAKEIFRKASDADGMAGVAQLATAYGTPEWETEMESFRDMPKNEMSCARAGGMGALAESKAWKDHVYIMFSGMQGRPVGNTVKKK